MKKPPDPSSQLHDPLPLSLSAALAPHSSARSVDRFNPFASPYLNSGCRFRVGSRLWVTFPFLGVVSSMGVAPAAVNTQPLSLESQSPRRNVRFPPHVRGVASGTRVMAGLTTSSGSPSLRPCWHLLVLTIEVKPLFPSHLYATPSPGTVSLISYPQAREVRLCSLPHVSLVTFSDLYL